MAYVYAHKRKDTGEVFYVGIASDKKSHQRAKDKRLRSEFWKSYTKRHPYAIEITHDNIIWEEACAIEQYLIAFYGRRDLGKGPLLNLTDGGDGAPGVTVKEHSRKLISDKLKGKVFSEETKLKISQRKKGHTFTDEAKEKIANTLRGRKLPKEHRESISKGHKRGVDSKFFSGFIEVFKDGESLGVYAGTGELMRRFGMNKSKVVACLNGRRERHMGCTYKRILSE
jgi:hypothetical protein